jgi:hypothetical protein
MPESTIAGGSGTASTFIRIGDEVLVDQLVPPSLVKAFSKPLTSFV